MGTFYRDLTDNTIYRYNAHSDYYLKLTNIAKSEDRRIKSADFDASQKEKIKIDKAMQIVNDYWFEKNETWVHDGETYHTESIDWDKFLKCKHSYPHSWIDKKGITHTWYFDYYLVWHQGDLWTICTARPISEREKICLEKFSNNFDTEPSWHHPKWTSIKHCKMVVNSKGKII